MKRTRLYTYGVVASFLGGHSAAVLADEVMQRLGGYSSDASAETHSAATIGGEITQRPLLNGNISSGAYDLEAGIEQVTFKDISHDNYMKENFPSGTRENRSVSLNTTQTIRKLTDLRLGANWLSDSVTTTKTFSGGIGHWWFHDTIQTNVDISKTQTDGTAVSILDYDQREVILPPQVNSGGGTLSVKHLATPTTVWGASWTRIDATNRPPLNAYALNGKQFIPAWDAAIHGSVARVINTGDVGLDTSSGSLTGTQSEIAFLKNLWQGAASRVAYRFVREDEQTRAYGDHLLYGADSYSLGMSQEVKKGVVTDRPLKVHAVATRYLSNSGGAFLGEAGLTTKF